MLCSARVDKQHKADIPVAVCRQQCRSISGGFWRLFYHGWCGVSSADFRQFYRDTESHIDAIQRRQERVPRRDTVAAGA